jgi:hypothetical protein
VAENNGKEDVEIVKAEPVEVDQLPTVTPPSTKAPVQFNQQVNIYQQIPQSAWDRLTADQVMDLSKTIIQQIDIADKRQFDYAVDQAKKEESRKTFTSICGTLVAIVGFGLTAYLAMHGHEMISLTISLPLATILAIIVGNKVIGS